MKKNMIMIAMISIVSASAFASGASGTGGTNPPAPVGVDQGHGNINFKGSIIDAPCSISPDTANQIVEMGQISNALLNSSGESSLRPFEIKLEGCAITTASAASITFTGMATDTKKDKLAINGSAKGAAIAIVNASNGEPVVLGTPTSAIAINSGDNNLMFGAKVVSTLDVANGETAVPGNFTATANFVMKYQ